LNGGSVINVTVGFSKPSSRNFCVVLSGAREVVDRPLLMSAQPSGRLRNFFMSAFETDNAVEDAFRNGGGSLIVRTRDGIGPRRVRWVRLEDGFPALVFEGGERGAAVEVKLLIEGEGAPWL
jgi:hypothetical protein